MKATYGEINGEGYNIYKSPKTDSGMKNSAKGLLHVKNGILTEECDWFDEVNSDLTTVFYEGMLLWDDSLEDIRKRLWP